MHRDEAPAIRESRRVCKEIAAVAGSEERRKRKDFMEGLTGKQAQKLQELLGEEKQTGTYLLWSHSTKDDSNLYISYVDKKGSIQTKCLGVPNEKGEIYFSRDSRFYDISIQVIYSYIYNGEGGYKLQSLSSAKQDGISNIPASVPNIVKDRKDFKEGLTDAKVQNLLKSESPATYLLWSDSESTDSEICIYKEAML